MLSIALCDDMSDVLLQMKDMILHWNSGPEQLIVHTFQDADAFLSAHTASSFDIIFLDVIMHASAERHRGSQRAAPTRSKRKNSLILLGISVLLGSFQLIVLTSLSEEMVWKLYPLIVHIPLTVILCLIYKKRIVTVLASVLTVYLCCQSAKWFGVVTYYITQNTFAETQMRICILILGAFIILKFLAPFLSAIFNSETTIVCTFGLIPLVYYLFDYFAIIYTDLWMSNNRVVAEFLPFFLGIAFLFFGIVYYKEYEQRSDAERKEKLVRITTEQQIKRDRSDPSRRIGNPAAAS